MALLRGTVLFAAGLLMLVSALPGELRGQRSPVSGTEYGVKLCGREFIRAVIFTCGGSRWKRLPAEPPEEEEQRESGGFLRRDKLQDSTNREVNQLMLQALLGTNLEQLQKPDFNLQQQQLLKDPFSAYDDLKDRKPASEDFSEYLHQVEDTDRKIQRESQNSGTLGSNWFPWITLSRTRREMSIGVAGICCKWGCTKAEISTLC